MKKLFMLVIGLSLSLSVMAQSNRQLQTKVVFKGLGEYSSTQTEMFQGDKSRTDTENVFKGNGLANNAMAGLLLRSGNDGKIMDLGSMMMYTLNHKKKEYTESQLKPYEAEDIEDVPESDEAWEEEEEEEAEEPEESSIEVIRTRFEVNETGDRKQINAFDARLYTILWLREWRNVDTEETGTDSLFTEVWTTDMSNDMQRAQAEEQAFHQQYAEKLGYPTPAQVKELYGMNWIQLFNQMQPADESGEVDWGPEAEELQKIQGHPVIIDGRFFAIRPQDDRVGEDERQESPKSLMGTRKLLGGLAKKAAKKAVKEKVGPKVNAGDPDVQFYTELKAFDAGPIEPDKFRVPVDYRKK